mgnify:CR=1 FL=1
MDLHEDIERLAQEKLRKMVNDIIDQRISPLERKIDGLIEAVEALETQKDEKPRDFHGLDEDLDRVSNGLERLETMVEKSSKIAKSASAALAALSKRTSTVENTVAELKEKMSLGMSFLEEKGLIPTPLKKGIRGWATLGK